MRFPYRIGDPICAETVQGRIFQVGITIASQTSCQGAIKTPSESVGDWHMCFFFSQIHVHHD